MKNVLVISSSLRNHSNSARLAQSFSQGATESGNKVEVISLAGKTISFCRGCMSCREQKRCVMRDDADIIEQKMLKADVLVFASPIYYYEMSGQLKTMLDRGNPLFYSDYKFRDVYFLSTAADEDLTTPSRAISGIEGWIACFDNAHLAGTVFCGGVDDVGDIEGRRELIEAYEMGKSIK